MANPDHIDTLGGTDRTAVREVMPRTTYALAATGLTFDKKLSTGGCRVTRYLLECPNTSGGGTTTLSFIDGNSVTIWSGAANAETANYSIPVDVELVGTYTVRLTLSATADVAATAYLTLYGF